ncbi:hypothetical protein FQA39_LY07547 [Lamprigera yunnana]|nr:hypothetical protein FQA39_LY07547 [Lamprigera yunnana]
MMTMEDNVDVLSEHNDESSSSEEVKMDQFKFKYRKDLIATPPLDFQEERQLSLSASESGKNYSIDDPIYSINNNELSEVEDNFEFIGEEGDDEVPIDGTNLEMEEKNRMSNVYI